MNLYTDEMPKSCDECEFREIEEFGCDTKSYCHVGGHWITDKTVYSRRSKRSNDCPLKPLPKCECEKLKGLVIKSQNAAAHAQNKWFERVREIGELRNKLAAAERALELMYRSANKIINYEHEFNYQPIQDTINTILRRATAELKAEKGEGK